MRFLLNLKLKYSHFAIVLAALAIVLHDIERSDYKDDLRIIESDVIHYYAFLPALLVYNDLSLGFIDTKPDYFTHKFWPVHTPEGYRVIMTTMGMSLMYAPFVIPVHYFLEFTGQPATGFSAPYKVALLFASLFYTITGLILLRKMLLRRFPDLAVALVLFSTVLATNLIFYATRLAAFTHAFSFFLLIGLAWASERYYSSPSVRRAALVGFIAALITLVRPTNALLLILFPLWGIDSPKSLRERLQLFLKNYSHLLVLIAVAVFCWGPQLVYWKQYSGQWFFNGYADKGMFFFDNPQIINVLFSYRKGWLLYTPVMILALCGFFWLWKSNRDLFWPLLIVFLLHLYLVSSWWLWWFGGSFGHRAFVDIYGLLAFPLAAFFSQLISRRRIFLKVAALLIALLLAVHNIFQMYQFHNGAIHYVANTKESYWDSFLRLKPSPHYYHLLVNPDYEAAREGIYPKPVVTYQKPKGK